jgi:hypothetical protein
MFPFSLFEARGEGNIPSVQPVVVGAHHKMVSLTQRSPNP